MIRLRKLLIILLFVLFSSAAFAEQVNINTADAPTIAAVLDGVGAVKAQAIVAYRDSNGPFQTLEDLLNVNGIGPATLEKNRDRISLADSGATTAGSGN